MKTPSRLIPAAIVAVLLTWTATASATKITFDELEFAGGSASLLSTVVQIGDFNFLSVNAGDAKLIAWQQSSSFYNGSAGISASNSADILMTRIDGGVFDVHSVDVDSLFGGFSVGHEFEFVGSLAAGGEITQSFAPDFTLGNETVVLNGFNDLIALLFSGTGPAGPQSVGLANIGSVDNIDTVGPNVVAVAEAPSVALFGMGLFALVLSRRRLSRKY